MAWIEKDYTLQAPVSRVFSTWLSEDAVFPPTERLEIEPVVGGAYRLIMPGGFTMHGQFLELLPDARLRYSWRWDGDEVATEVSVDFEASGDDTLIRLRHGAFADADALARHSEGWDAYMARMRDFLTGEGAQ